MRIRKQFSNEFKAKVALEALKNTKTVAELSSEYGVHQTQITTWRNQLKEQASGVFGNPGQGNYAASKAGMIGMTKSLAREVASRGITANCIAPGFITTPMTQALNAKQTEEIAKMIPSQRFGTSEEVAAGVVYLASEEAGYITGQTLHINGGMAMV